MQLAFAAVTDVGLVRTHNEDFYVAEKDLGLFAVVDGMGGHAAGEVASRTIATSLIEFIRATQVDPEKTWPFPFDPSLSHPANRLQVAIRTANRQLADLISSNERLGGTGATVSAVLFDQNQLAISNVGDCRAYLIRGGEVYQITRDHSFVAEQVASGMINAEDAKRHPLRHLVTRAVSGNATINIDTWDVQAQPNDRVLLCSDGVHGLLTDEELGHIALKDATIESICQELVDAAKARGGTDNSTAVIVQVHAMPTESAED
jgi:serine/threonine protein phosphatase PrpC